MNNKLPILAIETSGELCSVAVMIDDKTHSEININQKFVHSEKLVMLVSQVLESIGLKLKDIGHIAVSGGPGSFTGLRIGMSAVKGLAIGTGLPVVAVPTFEALALKICSFVTDADQFFIATKVNVDELYIGKYKKVGDTFEVITPVSLLNKKDFESNIVGSTRVFGNFHKFDRLKSVYLPTALDIAKWSYFFGSDLLTFEYDYLEPNYLKNFVAKVKK